MTAKEPLSERNLDGYDAPPIAWTALSTSTPVPARARRGISRTITAASFTVATHPFDLVVEGEAVKVTDDAELRWIADVFAAEGWESTVRDGALHAEFSAPSAGPPPGTSTRSRRRRSSPWGRPSPTAPPASASEPGSPLD